MANTVNTTAKHIDAEISAFTLNRDALRQHAHSIAMLIFYRAAPEAAGGDCTGNGDCTRALKLARAMPKSWADQMVTWFETFTPIRVKVKAGTVGFDARYKALKGAENEEKRLEWWKLEEANTTPFFELSEEKGKDDYKAMSFEDLMKLIPALANRIEKMIEQNKVKEEDEASAVAMAEQLKVLKFQRVAPPANTNTEPTEQGAGGKAKKAA